MSVRSSLIPFSCSVSLLSLLSLPLYLFLVLSLLLSLVSSGA